MQSKNPLKLLDIKVGLAENTVKRIYSIVHKSLEDALALELVSRNVASLIPHKPKNKQSKIQVWDEKQLSEFLSWGKNRSRLYISYFLAIVSGCRQGEVHGLRWSDINFDNSSLSVEQVLTHKGKNFKDPKTISSFRTIALSPKTIEQLKEHKLRIDAEKKAAGSKYHDLDLVVCSLEGKPVKPRDIMKEWKKLIELKGLPYITYHSLRHSHATQKSISLRLGHKSVQITMDIYARVTTKTQEAIADGLDEMIF